jgi:coproporphyrinogen III oxidase-like Fe-S oxidoreductase
VTLKMLAFLYAAPDQKIYFEDFNKSFNDQDGLLTRLEMMKNNELIEYQNENLRLTTKAFKLLKIVSVIDKIFSIKKF